MDFKTDVTALDDVKEDCNALRIISPAYAGRNGELTAILQYVYQSIVFGELGNPETAKTLVSVAVDEMRHLELLGTAIVKLGAPPMFTACPPYPVGYYSAANVNYARAPRQMICADICAEENTVAEYERMLCTLKNPPVSALISRILSDEKRHLQILQELLSQF